MWMYQYNSLNDWTERNFGCTGTAPPRVAGNVAPICLALLACFFILMPGWGWQGWPHSIGRLSDTKGRNENRLRDRWSWKCVRVCVCERERESKCVYVDVYSSVFELLSWKCLWKCLSEFVCKCLCLNSTNLFKFVESVVACGSCPGLNKNNKCWKSFEFNANQAQCRQLKNNVNHSGLPSPDCHEVKLHQTSRELEASVGCAHARSRTCTRIRTHCVCACLSICMRVPLMPLSAAKREE